MCIQHRLCVAAIVIGAACCSGLASSVRAAESPADARHLISEGRRAEAQGDRATAMQKYREALALKPHDRQLLRTLALWEERVGNSRNAERLWERLCALEPASADAALHRGLAALKNDNLASAVDVFQRVTEMTKVNDPQHARAEQGLNAVMARSPYYRSKILAARGRQLQQRLDAEARQKEIHSLSRQAAIYQSMIAQGRQLFGEKRYQEAMNAFDLVLRIRPADPEAYRLRQAADLALQREADNAVVDASINNLMSSQRH